MAGLKKSKKDGSSPNIVLVVFLIFFVLLSIGLGVLSYYGFEGQEKLRKDYVSMKNAKDVLGEQAKAFQFGFREAGLGIGLTEMSPDAKVEYNASFDDARGNPDRYKDSLPVVIEIRKKNLEMLGAFSEAEKKYEKTYSEVVKAAKERAAEAESKLAALKTEYDEFKKKYDTIVVKYEADYKKLQSEIAAGNTAALDAAKVVNDKFPALQTVLVKLQDDTKKRDEAHISELKDRDDQLARKQIEIDSLKKRLEDRTLGLASGGGASSDTILHALMLDISRGLPIWDRPLGKIIRIDPANLMVYIDIGSSKGISPETTFQVFSGTPQGKADRQLKGTIEVVRVVDENTSICRITSLYDQRGYLISLASPEDRMRALRDTENMFRDNDLLFNTFFDSHIAIVGNVGFERLGTESPRTQQLKLEEFVQVLRKQHIYVDTDVNLVTGEVEGMKSFSPRTRLLVRGDFTPLNNNEAEIARVKSIKEAYDVLERQAVANGMFVISAENFAVLIGYRPAQSQLAKEPAIGFRPLLPFVNTNDPRIRNLIGAPPSDPAAPPAAPAAPPAEKKE